MLPGEEANIFYKCYLILTTPLRLSEWYLVTVWGTIKIRLWFLKFIFVSWRTHTLICMCCLYNILGTTLMVHRLRFHFQCRGCGFDPWFRELRSHRLQGQKNQNIKQKRYCNKLNKDFKNGSYQKTYKILYYVLYIIYIHTGTYMQILHETLNICDIPWCIAFCSILFP